MFETVGKIRQSLMIESRYCLQADEINLDYAINIYNQAQVLQLPVVDKQQVLGLLDLFTYLRCVQLGEQPLDNLLKDYDRAEAGTDILTIEDVKYDILVVVDGEGLYQGLIRRETLDRLVIIRMMEQRYLASVLSYKALKEEYDSVLDHSYDGIFITDGRGVPVKISHSCEQMEGIKVDHLLGYNMQELLKKGYYSESVALKAIKQRKQVHMIQTAANGRELLVTGTPVFKDQKILRIVINTRDMSELNGIKRDLEEINLIQQNSAIQFSRSLAPKSEGVVASSLEMRNLIELAIRIAPVESTVLLQGESGVGKEVIAKLIHQNSKKWKGPFIKIDCASIPDNLLESELFGYEKGAFTGASASGKVGLIELADQGTLFLDEIGEMPLNLQVKLLRVLQDREIMRIGGQQPIPINIRVIAATNRDLKAMVDSRTFREDLYYRLNVIPIAIPPLRNRRQDIKPLIMHFLKQFNQRYSLNKAFDEQTMRYLIEYNWLGNVRELENMVERLVVTSPGPTIMVKDLPANISIRPAAESSPQPVPDNRIPFKSMIETYEKEVLQNLSQTVSSMQDLADKMQMDVTTVRRKLKKYGVETNYSQKT